MAELRAKGCWLRQLVLGKVGKKVENKRKESGRPPHVVKSRVTIFAGCETIKWFSEDIKRSEPSKTYTPITNQISREQKAGGHNSWIK